VGGEHAVEAVNHPPIQVPSREPSALPVLQTSSPTETRYQESKDSKRALTLQHLGNLPQKMGSFFLLNIDDWNSPSLGCEEQAYEDVDTLFRNFTSVPVYVVLGDNEYNGTLNGPQ
jgi:hypothetical protein